MPTATLLITNAYIDLGELEPGESPSASEYAQALIALNNLIGNWNIQDLMATAAVTATVSLVSGTQSYALGTRVSRIVSASVVMAAGPTFGLKILNAQEWNEIEDKDISSNEIMGLFYDAGFPTGTVYLAPRPLSGLTLTYVGWAAQSTFASLSTNNTLLPGYERALTSALAIELARWYPDRKVSPVLANAYKESMSEIRRLNSLLWGQSPAPVASESPVSPREVAA